MEYSNFFWLHIKKSGGQSVRSLLSPYYKQTDRGMKPKCFIQAKPEEYNDILNNYRITLGEYYLKRALFAKNFLYPDTWDHMYSFAFSRNPIDRCISMFYYRNWIDDTIRNKIKSMIKFSRYKKGICLNVDCAFDIFLELIVESHRNDSIFKPVDLHFKAHTASMFEDITDIDGNILLKSVYRLENLEDSLNEVLEICNIDHKILRDRSKNHKHKNKLRGFFKPSQSQKIRIEKIFSKDLDIYENAK